MQLQQAPHAPHQNPFLYGDLMPEEEEPTYNGLNQVTAFNTNTYSYDNNGNTTSDGLTKNYKWDAENRLIEIDYIGTSNKSVFSYDALGRRTTDAETVSGVTTTTRFLWCGSRICQTRDGTDVVQSRILNEGEYNAVTTQKAVYMPDQLGSIRDVVDATSGSLISSIDYSPYGNPVQTNGAFVSLYQYAGLVRHAQSNLNLATYRAQDGITGTFPSPDPIAERGGWNRYAYAGVNPTNSTDSLGLTPKDKWFGRNDRDFQKWYHRCWKAEDENEDIGDADKEDIERAYAEWLDRGRPQNGNCYNNNSRGSKRNCPENGSPKDIPPERTPIPSAPVTPIPTRPAFPGPFGFPGEAPITIIE